MTTHPDVKHASAIFCSEFKSECEGVQASLRDTSCDRHALLVKTSELGKKLTEAAVYLPAYDQRQCSALLKDLQECLSSSNPPRAKFSFASRKSKAAKEEVTTKRSTATLETAVQDATATGGKGDIFGEAELTAIPKSPQEGRKHSALPPADPTHSRTIADYVDRYVNLPGAADAEGLATASKDYYLLNLDRCVISMLTTPVAALHAKKLRNCLVIAGPIAGSVLLENCENCVFVLACRQFRMHHTMHADVFLHIPSHPIIEDCDKIRFAPYPAEDLSSLLTTSSMSRLFEMADLEYTPEVNRFDKVEDFKWLKRTPSPHWGVLAENERRIDWRTCALIPKEDGNGYIGSEDALGDTRAILGNVLPTSFT
ncbi:uncharacterized protein SPPG_03499 [Spizellomyces punctatus DAOM BR117]|uniref:C-CAP/cofactor C-like domain-containing protein n=1 Tax=Spizellomyces punctatus (strain DAOM BR117) TaxID=645134 RepID=A0A0L0HLM1_SPIPD|nr:uncharacterized protein SPPG_03499 [Spizellomyces punctatus DAOM BR117]KND01704.1 hypothetical protein SPPG_03499 [Spizellomyces punctatus DAOM BR117]|eukprot:XP_016609743.1 hypothetical protein SPPG_03499 [Spizellomyces punctatus DAOM BR117]